jgi:neutral ceramidase
MAPQYQSLGGQASKRSILAFSCLASVLVLALLAITQLGQPERHSSTLPLQRATPQQDDTPLLAKSRAAPSGDKYVLGVGKADITGPVVEINFAGYASLGQVGTGLRQRLYSRAFIIGDNSNPADRFVYLILDTQSGDTAVRFGILEGLQALGGDYAKYYGQGNVAVTGTHSHSGPGAWFNYLLPQVTSLGFDKQSYQAIVDGALLSIQRAHQSLTPGYLDFGMVNVTDANLSRSLWAYLNNPEEERAKYNTTGDDGSTDKALTLLRFQRASDLKNMGVLTWYAVHGTSLLVGHCRLKSLSLMCTDLRLTHLA